ncbi:MAG TPA: hypothetical protein VK466_10965, partial [Terriglobales bacterium]|nr:hypothetical protein [Terriglobales bacterium]
MLLGRLTHDIASAVAEGAHPSGADSTPVQSLTSVTQRANSDLALYPQEEANKLLETVTQLNSSVAMYPVADPVQPTPDPLGLHALIHFRPGVFAGRGGLGVAATKAGSDSASEIIANARTEADILKGAQKAGLSTDELNRLQQILDSSPDFKADASLLKEVLNSWGGVNADRALRTFMDLDP